MAYKPCAWNLYAGYVHELYFVSNRKAAGIAMIYTPPHLISVHIRPTPLVQSKSRFC